MHKTISLTVLLDGEASVAEARGSTLNNIGELSATGSAKKHPDDQADREVGFNLAVARALRALADRYEHRAEIAQNNPQRFVLAGDPLTSGSYITYTTPDPNSFYVSNNSLNGN